MKSSANVKCLYSCWTALKVLASFFVLVLFSFVFTVKTVSHQLFVIKSKKCPYTQRTNHFPVGKVVSLSQVHRAMQYILRPIRKGSFCFFSLFRCAFVKQ